MVAVTIPGMRIVSSQNRREHHMARHRRLKKLKADAGMMLLTLRPKPSHDAYIVTMTRYAPEHLAQDDDGTVAGFKAVRDSVAFYLGTDDGDTERLLFKCRQETGPWAARIEITEWDKSKCHECGATLEE